jgi:hypothetical protein
MASIGDENADCAPARFSKGRIPMTLDEKIAQAQRHVDSGRLIVARQRALVIRYEWPLAFDLLERFERTQQIFEMDLADLLKQRLRLQRLEEVLRLGK